MLHVVYFSTRQAIRSYFLDISQYFCFTRSACVVEKKKGQKVGEEPLRASRYPPHVYVWFLSNSSISSLSHMPHSVIGNDQNQQRANTREY